MVLGSPIKKQGEQLGAYCGSPGQRHGGLVREVVLEMEGHNGFWVYFIDRTGFSHRLAVR